jgi:hypothetical protein
LGVWIVSVGRFIQLSDNLRFETSIDALRIFDEAGLRPMTGTELGDLSDLPPDTALRSVRGSPSSHTVALRAGGGIYLFDDSGIPRHATRLTYEDLSLKDPLALNEISWQASQRLGLVFANASRSKKGSVHEFGGRRWRSRLEARSTRRIFSKPFSSTSTAKRSVISAIAGSSSALRNAAADRSYPVILKCLESFRPWPW